MTRIHALLIALAVSFAVVAGTFAALRTTRLGTSSSPTVSPTEIARQTRLLDRTQVQLQRALAKRPPKLPALPVTTVGTVKVPVPVAVPRLVTVSATAPVTKTSSSGVAGSGERDHEHNGSNADD